MILKQIWPELEASSRYYLSRGAITLIAMPWTCWECYQTGRKTLYQVSCKLVPNPLMAGGQLFTWESLTPCFHFQGERKQFLLLLTFTLRQHLKWTIPLKNNCSFVSPLIFLFPGETHWIAIFIDHPQSWYSIEERGPDRESKNLFLWCGLFAYWPCDLGNPFKISEPVFLFVEWR